MKKVYLLLILHLTFNINAQEKLPILQANSPILSIKEGALLTSGVWGASPEVIWDEFVTNPFKGEQQLSFISDIDTLSFTLLPNKTYDFIVLLAGKNKAFTRISTDISKEPSILPKKIMSYQYVDHRKALIRDTLPFSIGSDNRIYLKGRINQSDTLDFIFDTGANAMVITKDLIGSKVNMQLDGTGENEGSDGTQTVSTSSNNIIEIGHLKWDSVQFITVNYKNMLFDAVMGWNAFERKIVELDYEKQIIVIHNNLISVPQEYQKIDTKMIDGIPYIKCSLINGELISEGWIEFDTGYNYSILLSQSFIQKVDLSTSLTQTGSSSSKGSVGIQRKLNEYILPELKIGDFSTYQIPITISTADPEGIKHNDFLGNALLKRFNAILDFQNHIIYLKPNTLIHSEYYKRKTEATHYNTND